MKGEHASEMQYSGGTEDTIIIINEWYVLYVSEEILYDCMGLLPSFRANSM